MTEIGKRENAIKIKNVGGKAFKDYNWTCNVCKNDNRAFEATCRYCLHEKNMEVEG